MPRRHRHRLVDVELRVPPQHGAREGEGLEGPLAVAHAVARSADAAKGQAMAHVLQDAVVDDGRVRPLPRAEAQEGVARLLRLGRHSFAARAL